MPLALVRIRSLGEAERKNDVAVAMFSKKSFIVYSRLQPTTPRMTGLAEVVRQALVIVQVAAGARLSVPLTSWSRGRAVTAGVLPRGGNCSSFAG